jgi:hypothetical protein
MSSRGHEQEADAGGSDRFERMVHVSEAVDRVIARVARNQDDNPDLALVMLIADGRPRDQQRTIIERMQALGKVTPTTAATAYDLLGIKAA